MPRSMDHFRRDAQTKYDPPPTNPTEALAHVLRVFDYEPDTHKVLTATGGVYEETPWTGLTMGDLRALQTELVRLRTANATGHRVCPQCDEEQTTCTLCGTGLEP